MAAKGTLTIDEVIENLNTIVEATSLGEIEITEKGEWLSHAEARERAVLGVPAAPNEETLTTIRETFRTIHKYLQAFYRKMKESSDKQRFVEGINTVMVLVGEAAAKLEKFDSVFKERLPGLEEYKDLQNFYRNKIIKESFKEFKTIEKVKKVATPEEKWEQEFDAILAIDEGEVEESGAHILNDIEVIKNDHLYELFELKNERGHNFYTEDLSRKLKLACDFGEFSKHFFGDDPLLQIKNWQDMSLHLFAKRLVATCGKGITQFFREAMKYREVEIVSLLHKSLLGLMLAANPRNLIRGFSMKGCYLYFQDFQSFLRDVFSSRDYQKFLVYAPPENTPFFSECFTLIHELAYHLMSDGLDLSEVEEGIKEIITKDKQIRTKHLSTFLNDSDHNLRSSLKNHPSGPVFKALDIIREESTTGFDPLLQGNLPTPVYILKTKEREIIVLNMPSPTIQQIVNLAEVASEFKAFLHAASLREGKHVTLINFQDRTSWKEHARCAALENLAKQAEFASALTVVTLAKDSEFYNQSGPYHDLSDASDFIAAFHEHISDESTGYYFPQTIKKKVVKEFALDLLGQIHAVFFEKSSTLGLRARLDFIEIAYSFLTLKMIELLEPDFLALTSKDGLDIGGVSTLSLLALLTISQKHKFSAEELAQIDTLLYGPTLLQRERAIHKIRFDRLHDMIHLLEKHPGYLKEFKELYSKSTLEMKVELRIRD